VIELRKNSTSNSLLDLISNISDLIVKLGKHFEQRDNIIFRSHSIQGITPPQLFILRALWLQDEWQLKYLALLAKVSQATMTGIIDTMEKNDLVKRIPNPQDGRSILIKLTEKGEDLKKYKPPLELEKMNYFKDFKLEELQDLNYLLNKLFNSLESK